MTPEQLITELTLKNEKLEKELSQAQQDIKDFEELAIIWKENYRKMEANYKVKIGNLEKTVDQLKEELDEHYLQ